MINVLFKAIFNLFFQLARAFVFVFTIPLYGFLEPLFPNLDNYMLAFNDFLEDYVFHGLAFAREVFINVTCMPRELFTLLVTLTFSFITLAFSLQPALFIANSIANVKKGVLR
jgi:hypothetical protein